jgi:Rad3-related DNA helicase
MRFVPGQRAVAMSVGEFSTFRLGPADVGGGRSGAWRAAVGSAWHQALRSAVQQSETAPIARFEVPLSGRLWWRGWTIELQGRLDQIVPRDGLTWLREIKTVSGPLPRSDDELLREYPEYFCQLAAYLRLAELDHAFASALTPGALAAELVLVDFSTGLTQSVPLPAADVDRWLERQLDTLYPYLEYRWNSWQRLSALPVRAAFAELRPGQAEARAALENIHGHAGVVIFEAPTGFGKTGILLEYALARLRLGHCRRLLYLTGKGTGQAPVVAQLRALLGPEPELRFLQLRSRREHAINSPAHACDERGNCREDLEARWHAAAFDPPALFDDGTLSLEKSRRLGAQSGVCPYEITRAALPYAEVWICDYNYVFSPTHRSVLFNQPDFDPALTLLILDEAHNLPARAADARSHTFTAEDASFAADSLRHAGARPNLIHAADQLAEFLDPLRPADKLDLTATYSLADHLESLVAELRAAPAPDTLPDAALDFLWSGADALNTLRDGSLDLLPWVPAKGTLRLSCLDAAPAIAAALREFGQAVLTSATFGPHETCLASLGLDAANTQWISATAPWREGAYTVAVDARVDTRLRARASHYATTAETVRLFSAGQPRPIAVFFPSYDYAEAVRTYVTALDSGLRVAMQPRGADLAAQTAFLEESLLTAHAIFLVLGGSFAEGIDRLGGEVKRAMVVSPALPEPGPVNEARRAHLADTLGADAAFRRVYLAPGLLKISQALGRLVRAPGQRARVLLHCRRFAEPATQELLAPEFRSSRILRTGLQFAEWLNQPADPRG